MRPDKKLKKMKKKKDRLTWQNAEPWNLVKKHLDVWDGDKQRDASEVGPLALGYLGEFGGRPFFFFLHFSDPDHNGHKYGENSEHYSGAIITCDGWLVKLRRKLTELGIADRTLIYVTTDHGFDEGEKSHKNAPHIWIATNDKSIAAAAGDQMDITPTILAREGVDPAVLSPPLPGRPLF